MVAIISTNSEAATAAPRASLVRTIRQRDLFLLFIGSVIGSGVFLTPGLILRQLDGSVGYAFLVWIIGGILSLLGALTYAELAAANPEAGGLYVFIRDGFGRMPAFLYGWCLFLVIASGSVAALARAFTRYLAEIIKLTSGHRGQCLGHAQKLRLAKLDHADQSWNHRRAQCRAALAWTSRPRNSHRAGLITVRLFASVEFRTGDDRCPMGLRRLAVRHV